MKNFLKDSRNLTYKLEIRSEYSHKMFMQRRLLSTFKAGDVVLVRNMFRPDKVWLSKPLVAGGKINMPDGHISHDELFNKKSRDIIKSSTEKHSYIVTLASTEDYISLVRRNAQPIYPYDAAAIVNIADFRFDYPELTEDNTQLQNSSPIQILEAGTGHGSLALAICGQLHATNCFLKKFGVRGGVLHSIDCNQTHSTRGSQTVRDYRRGIYKDDVKFHISESPTKWLQEESEEWRTLEQDKEDGFLSGAFLDMPDIHDHVEQIAKDLKQDAPLIVFCPSVTQILDVVNTIRESEGSIKLSHARTIALQPGMGGGLEEWDVRYTNIRGSGGVGVVCRPKVGSRVVGGGFIGVFKKLPNSATLLPKHYNEENLKTQY